MLTKLILIGTLVFASILPNYFNATTDFSESHELVVKFQKLSPKQYGELDKSIATVPGIKDEGHCERLKVFFFSYDTSVYRTDEDAFNAIEKSTKAYLPMLKVGTSAEQLKTICATK